MLSHLVKKTLPKVLLFAVIYELSVRLGQWGHVTPWLWPVIFGGLILVGAVLLTMIEHIFWHLRYKRLFKRNKWHADEWEAPYATDEA